jgi:predicted nucleotidyltransferase
MAKEANPPPGDMHTPPEDAIPRLLDWEERLVSSLERPLKDAIAVVREYGGYITRIYLSGSFARGDMRAPPKDVDIILSLSNSAFRENMGEESSTLKHLLGRVEGIGAGSVKLHFNFCPHGRVLRAEGDGTVTDTGEVRGEDVLAALKPESREGRLLVDVTSTDLSRQDFFQELYRNLKMRRMRG